MTYWNYRVLAIPYTEGVYFEIREVYYKDGTPEGYSDGKSDVMCGDIEGVETLGRILDNMKDALTRPILWGGDNFPKEYEPQH
jgi:hypothetical protein